MNDLVKRLREGVEWDESGPFPDAASFVMDKAADRIEQLEKAVANLLKVRGRYHSELAYKELERVYHESPNSSN